MSYSQLGYPYGPSAGLAPSQMLNPGSGMSNGSHSTTPAACESNRSNSECQYPTSPLLPPAYTSLPSLSDYSSSVYSHMPQFRPDTSAFYNPLVSNSACYDAKEGVELWRGVHSAATASAACYAPYDPSYPYAAGYPNMALSGAQRKNATREATSTLKAWLHDHIKNPYPTKGEKIMLAIITKMTLTQVSTWFANARRRLKKENKMTWSPRNRCEDDEDEDGDENEKKEEKDEKPDCVSPTAGCSSFSSCASLTSSSPRAPRCPSLASPLKTSPGSSTPGATPDDKPRIWSVSDVLTSNAVATSLPTTLSARSAWFPAHSAVGAKPLTSLGSYPLPHSAGLGLSMYGPQHGRDVSGLRGQGPVLGGPGFGVSGLGVSGPPGLNPHNPHGLVTPGDPALISS